MKLHLALSKLIIAAFFRNQCRNNHHSLQVTGLKPLNWSHLNGSYSKLGVVYSKFTTMTPKWRHRRYNHQRLMTRPNIRTLWLLFVYHEQFGTNLFVDDMLHNTNCLFSNDKRHRSVLDNNLLLLWKLLLFQYPIHTG